MSKNVNQLIKLRGLYLSSNDLEDVPESLAECERLQECYLDNNFIRHIPDTITQLPQGSFQKEKLKVKGIFHFLSFSIEDFIDWK